jgi:hypothetical protein
MVKSSKPEKKLRRTGPRFFFVFDFNLQWLAPKFSYGQKLGYIHMGWLSLMFGFGIARDTFFDTLDKGLWGAL